MLPLKTIKEKLHIKWSLGLLLLIPTLIFSATGMAHMNCAQKNKCQEKTLTFVALYFIGVIFLCCFFQSCNT